VSPKIFASVYGQSSPVEQELKRLSVSNTVTEAKAAVMRTFNLHPAKQSLVYIRRQRGFWMQDHRTIASYQPEGDTEDVRIRVYVSFELIFKHEDRWLTIPCAACDTVLVLQSKLAKETGRAIKEMHVFLPAQAAGPAQPARKEIELMHKDDVTLMSYGIWSDLELRLEVKSLQPQSGQVQQTIVSARKPPLYAPVRNARTALGAAPPPVAAPVGAPPYIPKVGAAARASAPQASLASGNQVLQRQYALDTESPVARIVIKLGNFGESQTTSLVVPSTPCSNQLSEMHWKLIQQHIHATFGVHPVHQDFW
jgi:hypothetical protein